MGLGLVALIGAVFTLVTQLLLNGAVIKWKSYTPFLVIWFGGKLFGMMSTFAGQKIYKNLANFCK